MGTMRGVNKSGTGQQAADAVSTEADMERDMELGRIGSLNSRVWSSKLPGRELQAPGCGA